MQIRNENLTPEHLTKKAHWAHRLVWFILAFAAVIIGLLIYWSVSDNNVIDIHNDPVPVRLVSPTAEANGALAIKVDYCKLVNVTGKVRVSFVGSAREIFLPMTDEHFGKGCSTQEFPLLIPADIVPDTYHIHFKMTYQVNPIKSVVEEFNSRPFQVVKDD